MDSSIARPTGDDRGAWQSYWQQQGQPWRTEPEVPPERQAYLAERRAIIPDLQQGVYPFGGIRLTRADVEWLLATHENGRGPVDPNDESQRERVGLDLRGVNLSGNESEPVDLGTLPLAHVRFGLSSDELLLVTEEGRTKAQANIQNAVLRSADLRGANLVAANLHKVNLNYTNSQKSNFFTANLQEARLDKADLQGADLGFADLHRANLAAANLSSADLRDTNLHGANLPAADLHNANLFKSNLQSADLRAVNLHGADLRRGNLQGAYLRHANLSGANFHDALLQGANLRDTNLRGANLSNVTFDDKTRLDDALLDAEVILVDIAWGGANLVNVDWSPVTHTGDETNARQRRNADGAPKERHKRWMEFRAAVRAYRLLATTLRDQGMNEEADRFAYRAQVCQRVVLRLQRKRGQYLWSGLLDLIAGYGYRPARSFVAYLLIILSFAAVYFLFGQASHPLSPPESVVVSMTAFHGRGFFSGQFSPGDPQAYAAALEAFLGLMIEVSFIATFTQRYFGK